MSVRTRFYFIILICVFFYLVVNNLDHIQNTHFEKRQKTDKNGNVLPNLLLSVPETNDEKAYYSLRKEKINPFIYRYLINSTEACDTQTVVVVVNSRPSNHEYRQAIRKTWGSVVHGMQWPHNRTITDDIKLLFAFGIDKKWNKQLIHESEQYADIIQGDFLDSYNNLTLKSLLGMHWFSKNCPTASYYLKSDDDMFINIPYLLDILNSWLHPQRSIIGPLVRGAHARRTGKWKIDTSIYPFSIFPPYEAGSAYIMTADLVQELIDAAEYFPQLFIDDVYITGVLGKVIGVYHINQPGFAYWRTPLRTACDFLMDKAITGHRCGGKCLITTWTIMHTTTKSSCRTRSPLNGTVVRSPMLSVPETDEEKAYYRLRKEKVNPFSYRYLISDTGACYNQTGVVVVVNSWPSNHEYRQAIRKTWGSVVHGMQWPHNRIITDDIKLLFAVGIDEKWNKQLIHESKQYADIIQGDFLDNDKNLTLKSLLGMHWFSKNCPTASYYLKSDDDMFINIPYLLDILNSLLHPQRTIIGPLLHGAHARRTGQWKIDTSIYPFKKFPPYDAGSTYILTADLVQELIDAAEYFPQIYIDNVYITGVLAKVIGVYHIDLPGLADWRTPQHTACDLLMDRAIASHKCGGKCLIDTWAAIHSATKSSCMEKALKEKLQAEKKSVSNLTVPKTTPEPAGNSSIEANTALRLKQ